METFAFGATVQLKALPEKSDDRAVLANPATAVRLIVGKNAARAAPISAFAARN